MELIFIEISKAFGYLLVAVVVFISWELAKNSVESKPVSKVLLEGLLWCIGLALIGSIQLCEPTCIESETDMRGSICYEYADDGYEPSSQQRAAKFAYLMTLLYTPVIVGALYKKFL